MKKHIERLKKVAWGIVFGFNEAMRDLAKSVGVIVSIGAVIWYAQNVGLILPMLLSIVPIIIILKSIESQFNTPTNDVPTVIVDTIKKDVSKDGTVMSPRYKVGGYTFRYVSLFDNMEDKYPVGYKIELYKGCASISFCATNLVELEKVVRLFVEATK